MSASTTTLKIDKDTETLVVDLPEFRSMPVGQWVAFMVGTRDIVFSITRHDADGTHLTRVRTGRK